MRESTKTKIELAYQNLISQGVTPSVRALAKESETSLRNALAFLQSKAETETPTKDSKAETVTPNNRESETETLKESVTETPSKSETPLKKMLAETQFTPSTSFRTPEEVNQLANYLLNEKKEVTEEEIFTRYAEQGELDAFIKEMNFIRRNIGSLFLRCKPLLSQLIKPFPDEYKERALKELNSPVRN